MPGSVLSGFYSLRQRSLITFRENLLPLFSKESDQASKRSLPTHGHAALSERAGPQQACPPLRPTASLYVPVSKPSTCWWAVSCHTPPCPPVTSPTDSISVFTMVLSDVVLPIEESGYSRETVLCRVYFAPP